MYSNVRSIEDMFWDIKKESEYEENNKEDDESGGSDSDP